MFKKLFLFVCLSFVPIHLKADIVECQSIQSVSNYLEPDTVVFLNVTGTLYMPVNTLSSFQWREHLASCLRQKIPDAKECERMINHANARIVQIPKRLLELETPGFIAKLQAEGIPVLGLTQKALTTPFWENFGSLTSQHLVALGIALENTYQYWKPVLNGSESFALVYGILFTQKKPVWPAIEAFLESNPFRKIIVVDNSKKSLESIEAGLSASDIAFTGIYYSSYNCYKNHFNPTLGIIQFKAYLQDGTILTDEQAQRLLMQDLDCDYEQMLLDLILADLRDNGN